MRLKSRIKWSCDILVFIPRTNRFKYLKTIPEIITLVVIHYIRYPISLRQVEDILHERGIDVSHETIRYWWNRFGTLFSKKLRKIWPYVFNW